MGLTVFNIFHIYRLLKAQASNVRQRRVPPQTDNLSLVEVFTLVFVPVYTNQLPEIAMKLCTEETTLGDIDNLFRDISDKQHIMCTELLNLARLPSPAQAGGEAWVTPRLKQIQDYYSVQNQAQAAGELLKIRDAFELKGNFKPMEILNDIVSSLKVY